jgi:hypothetical protein
VGWVFRIHSNKCKNYSVGNRNRDWRGDQPWCGNISRNGKRISNWQRIGRGWCGIRHGNRISDRSRIGNAAMANKRHRHGKCGFKPSKRPDSGCNR